MTTLKHLLCGVALMLMSLGLFAQQPVMERLSLWLPDTVQLHGSLQGMALHRQYIVLLRHGGQCLILNRHRHRTVASFQLVDNQTHCNNASFSTLRPYGSPFPLLYISSCYGDKACLVTRLSHTGSSIVQRIFYHTDLFPVAQDWCLDPDSNYLYAYGGRKGGPMYLKKFRLPALSDSLVRLTDSDVLQTIPVNCVKVAQGSKIKNGLAFLPDGDSPGNYWLHIIHLASGREIQNIDLNPIGLEPEGIDIQGRWIYVSFNTPDPGGNKIYRFPLNNN